MHTKILLNVKCSQDPSHPMPMHWQRPQRPAWKCPSGEDDWMFLLWQAFHIGRKGFLEVSLLACVKKALFPFPHMHLPKWKHMSSDKEFSFFHRVCLWEPFFSTGVGWMVKVSGWTKLQFDCLSEKPPECLWLLCSSQRHLQMIIIIDTFNGMNRTVRLRQGSQKTLTMQGLITGFLGSWNIKRASGSTGGQYSGEVQRSCCWPALQKSFHPICEQPSDWQACQLLGILRTEA